MPQCSNALRLYSIKLPVVIFTQMLQGFAGVIMESAVLCSVHPTGRISSDIWWVTWHWGVGEEDAGSKEDVRVVFLVRRHRLKNCTP